MDEKYQNGQICMKFGYVIALRAPIKDLKKFFEKINIYYEKIKNLIKVDFSNSKF